MATAAVEAGAATVGALVAAHALDVTGGLLTASTLALLGLVVLPYRRQAQRAEFRKRVKELRAQMDGALAVRLDRELGKVRSVFFPPTHPPTISISLLLPSHPPTHSQELSIHLPTHRPTYPPTHTGNGLWNALALTPVSCTWRRKRSWRWERRWVTLNER